VCDRSPLHVLLLYLGFMLMASQNILRSEAKTTHTIHTSFFHYCTFIDLVEFMFVIQCCGSVPKLAWLMIDHDKALILAVCAVLHLLTPGRLQAGPFYVILGPDF
jgi:hypothetical protein